jgi:hypothetical protein
MVELIQLRDMKQSGNFKRIQFFIYIRNFVQTIRLFRKNISDFNQDQHIFTPIKSIQERYAGLLVPHKPKLLVG